MFSGGNEPWTSSDIAKRDAEIERLRAENADMKRVVEQSRQLHAADEREIRRLQDELRGWRDAYTRDCTRLREATLNYSERKSDPSVDQTQKG